MDVESKMALFTVGPPFTYQAGMKFQCDSGGDGKLLKCERVLASLEASCLCVCNKMDDDHIRTCFFFLFQSQAEDNRVHCTSFKHLEC